MRPALLIPLMLAACSTEPAKQDASNAPFDAAELDSKADSPNRPTKGVDLRVAELGQGTFTGSAGFISHQIKLTGGRVDIDLTGSEAGQPLDTILYVFGPKKANGKYPTRALAFNDDYEAPQNLGSHIVLDVPSDGTYQIVVSTYDNYIYFPFHVTRGDYRLIVKCQSEAFGACGAAVSGIDGQCWADEDCVAADGAPLHCEGEITCAPGTQCLFVRMGTCVADYAWMTFAAKQCNNNPWGQTSITDDEADAFPVRDLAQVKKHYGDITFDELGQLGPSENLAHCLSCNCARGDEIVVKVSTPDAAVLAQDGWIYSSSDPTAQSIAPKQCGTNPWQTAPAAGVSEELELVDSWLTVEGAKVTKRGFAWPAEPKLVCDSCSCSRGDRLLAFPVDANSHGILSSLGFGEIYVP